MFKTSVKEIRRNAKDQSEVELSDGSVQQFGMMVWSTGVESLDFIRELKIIRTFMIQLRASSEGKMLIHGLGLLRLRKLTLTILKLMHGNIHYLHLKIFQGILI